ncbi:MAG: porin [Pseudomonadota bacterium]|nr:porin [Pseudomonadota bacterium]
MRKILLATTALVGVAFGTAGVAHAAASPITVNVGGYVDAVAGFEHESVPSTGAGSFSGTGLKVVSHDFETEFKLNIDAIGKASNGVQYGANIGLWNGPEVGNLWTGGGSTVELNSAYVWLSGAFGKVLFGDEHGASDLFVYAPTIGEGQVDGRYQDFVSPFLVARFQPSGIDNTEHSTKITYYTPKVGNDSNKVQLGFSYAPQMYNYGQTIVKSSSNTALANGVSSPYQDLLKGAIQYTGNFRPVSLTASAQIINGSSQHTTGNPGLFSSAPPGTDGGKFQPFTAWGFGTQVGFMGFTVGGSYVDEGSYGTVHGQNHDQHVLTLGGKYEIDKVSVGATWLNGKGYDNLLSNGSGSGSSIALAQPLQNVNYVDQFNAYSIGATYTWFPGLTSAVDGTVFQQSVRDETGHNDGYVLLLSQKLTF